MKNSIIQIMYRKQRNLFFYRIILLYRFVFIIYVVKNNESFSFFAENTVVYNQLTGN